MSYQLNPEWLKAATAVFAEIPADKLIPHLEPHDVEGLRHNAYLSIPIIISKFPPVGDVAITKHEIKSFDGTMIDVYQFQPADAEKTNSPAALHIHGGGMIIGSVMMYDRQFALLPRDSGIPMFSVDYRLAPERKHPTQVEDGYAALLWLYENAEKLGIDKNRVALVGESAGAGLAAGVTLMARDRKVQPPIAKLLMSAPMLDHRTVSAEAFEPDFIDALAWKPGDNMTGWSALLGMNASDPGVEDIEGLEYASPARAKDLRGMPPTFVEIGTMDLFHMEAVEFAWRLVHDGQSMVELHVYPGLPHGYSGTGYEAEVVQRAQAAKARALADLKKQ